MLRQETLRPDLVMQLQDKGAMERYLSRRAAILADPSERRTASVTKPLGIGNVRGRDRIGTFVKRFV